MPTIPYASLVNNAMQEREERVKNGKAISLSRRDMSAWQWIQLTVGNAPTEIVEFLFGAMALTWGVWVALPWFDALAVATVWRLLLRIIPDEFTWGIISATIGSSLLFGLANDNKPQRFWSLLALTSLWFGFIPLFLFSDPRGVGPLWFALFCGMSGWATRLMYVRIVGRSVGLSRRNGVIK